MIHGDAERNEQVHARHSRSSRRWGWKCRRTARIAATPESGDSISNAARRHTASLGMIRLERMPTMARREPSVKPLICSSQPPMKRDAQKAERDDAAGERRKPRAEHERDRQRHDAFQEHQQPAAHRMLRHHAADEVSLGDRAARRSAPRRPPAIATNPSHFPIRICQRSSGLVAMA